MLKEEFEIYFQPQVFTTDGKIHGFEALLRWNHPTLGIVSPADFLPILEELTLLVDVEEWVIKQVCGIAKKLTDKFGELRFSINISGSHFKLGDLGQSIYLALQETTLDAHMLEIELTEDIMIEHVERSNNILTELSELGISIALDDFGKGYSSLSYLKDFPVDVLKIDKAFIDDIVSNQRELAIVEAMIDLSHKLEIKVVAEGVEYEEQVVLLKNKRCDFIQGYFFSKPMPEIELDAYLTARKSKSLKCG
ncbi:MAG: EAL domain-containing protein, partial [Kangiellaceae bacterium]|nr:EAL domain-containing protein [Kangiellaceae bacterium]